MKANRNIDSLVPYYRHIDEEFISSIASGREVEREMMQQRVQQCNYNGSTLPGIYITKFTCDVWNVSFFSRWRKDDAN